jgi:hypothetical protein
MRSAGGCAASTGTAGAAVPLAATLRHTKIAKACHAVQASKSARTAQQQRIEAQARQGFASPLRALDPITT